MAQSAAERIPILVSQLQAQLAELAEALAEVRQFSDSIGAMVSGNGAAAPVRRGPGRPRKDTVAPAAVPVKRGPGRPRKVVEPGAAVTSVTPTRQPASGERFGLTDFLLARLKENPGQRPMELVRVLVEQTGRPHGSASAGTSTTLTRLRRQGKVRTNRGKWYVM